MSRGPSNEGLRSEPLRAALAAALAGKAPVDGRTVIVLSGGNTDATAFAEVLAGQD